MGKKRSKRRQAHGSAWHWKQTDTWYYTEPGSKRRVALFDERGERIKGTANKRAAQAALARLMVAGGGRLRSRANTGPAAEWTVARVCDAYLGDLHRTATPEWATQAERWLNELCTFCGALKVSEVKKKHLQTWLQRHGTWGNSTQRNVISVVLAAFNYCRKFEGLDTNPLSGFPKPAATARVTSFSPAEEQSIYAATDARHAQFIKACLLTGARPYSELAKVTADHVVQSQQGAYYLLKAKSADGSHGHKTAKKTGKDRRILLCEEMEQITTELMKAAPRGSGIPLFRTARGGPWRKTNCVLRFRELKRKLKLPADRCMYTCRHTFAKRTLSGYYTGQPTTIEVLAGLMGNSIKVCWDHYAQWADQYNDPLWQALGKETTRQEAPKGNPRSSQKQRKPGRGT